MKPNPSTKLAAISYPQVLALLATIVALGYVLLPHIVRAIGVRQEGLPEALIKMRHLYDFTRQMTLDNEANGNPVRFTCSGTVPLTYRQWQEALQKDYLPEALLKNTLTVTWKRTFAWETIENPFIVFAVTESDPADTLLFVTRNWHGLSQPISGPPFDKTGFAVLRKDGTGLIVTPSKTGFTDFRKDDRIIFTPSESSTATPIGSGGMHNYLPLKE